MTAEELSIKLGVLCVGIALLIISWCVVAVGVHRRNKYIIVGGTLAVMLSVLPVLYFLLWALLFLVS